MFEGTSQLSSGLVFLGEKRIEIGDFSRLLGEALEAAGQRVESLRCLSETSAEVITASLHASLRVTCHREKSPAPGDDRRGALSRQLDGPLSEARCVLSIAFAPLEGAGGVNRTHLQAMLADCSYQIALLEDADLIQWLSPSALIAIKDFPVVLAPVAPRRAQARVSTRPRSQPVLAEAMRMGPSALRAAGGADAETLEHCFRTLDSLMPGAAPEADDDTGRPFASTESRLRSLFRSEPDAARPEGMTARPLLRLATWLISFSVGLFVLPLAIFLIICNLLRGEDLKLSAQALSLCGLMVALQANGAFAQVGMAIGL